MPPFDLSAYINPVQPLPNIDITGAYRQWQQHHLNEEHLAEQKREFNESEERSKYQFGQTQDYNNRVSNDINARFAITQGENTNTKNFNQQSDRFKQQQALLAKARAAATDGRWNEVESYLGTLKSLGADVGRTADSQGRPTYRLQEGQAPSAAGETYESSLGKINSNREANPFETSLGTVAQSARPGTNDRLAPTPAANPNLDTQQQTPQQPVQMIPGTNTPDDTLNQPASQQQSAQPQSQSFDPYSIDTAQMQRMNALRLDPLLAGIEGAFPNRFQPQIRSLLGGMKAMGASPESTLEMTQKPMDTAARLMGAELGAEGQMARASIGQGSSTATEERLREVAAENSAEMKAKSTGIYDKMKEYQQFDSIKERLSSGNPNAQADAMKELIGLREGGRITEQDFVIGYQGIASNFDQLKSQLQGIYQSGLKDWQVVNLTKMLEMIQKNSEKRLMTGAREMASYADAMRYEPEVYKVKQWIRGNFPQKFWPENIRKFDPQVNAGGRPVRTPNVSKPSVSVTAPTTQEATQSAEDLLREIEGE